MEATTRSVQRGARRPIARGRRRVWPKADHREPQSKRLQSRWLPDPSDDRKQKPRIRTHVGPWPPIVRNRHGAALAANTETPCMRSASLRPRRLARRNSARASIRERRIPVLSRTTNPWPRTCIGGPTKARRTQNPIKNRAFPLPDFFDRTFDEDQPVCPKRLQPRNSRAAGTHGGFGANTDPDPVRHTAGRSRNGFRRSKIKPRAIRITSRLSPLLLRPSPTSWVSYARGSMTTTSFRSISALRAPISRR